MKFLVPVVLLTVSHPAPLSAGGAETDASHNAANFTQLVNQHLAAERYTAAAAAQQRLVESSGGDTPAHWQRLIELMHWSSQPDAARHWLEEWKKRHPESTAPWLLQAQYFTWAGRDNEAVAELERALVRWPQDTELMARHAAAVQGWNHSEAAGPFWLRLFDASPSLREKLHWLPYLVEHQRDDGQVVKEFERRRANNKRSAAPLLALAERAASRYQAAESLALFREALRLAPGDAAVLTRTGEAAARAGDMVLAESLLGKALKLENSSAAQQRHALVLLVLERREEAAALLKGLAATLAEEELAELALMLTQGGYGMDAARMLEKGAVRFPDNYRLAWLRVEILLHEQEPDGLVEECLRLVTTPFPALPMPQYDPIPNEAAIKAGPILQPASERDAMAGEDTDFVTFLTMLDGNYGWREHERPPITLPHSRVPGTPAQLRGLAARQMLRLAREEGPEALAAAQAKLLAAGVPGARLLDIICADYVIQRDWRSIRDSFEQHPSLRPWLLRFLFGEPTLNPDLHPLASYNGWTGDDPTFGPMECLPAAREASAVFRGNDPVYFVFIALKLASSPHAADRGVVEEALALLEKEKGGSLLPGAVPHLGAASVRDDLPADSLLRRLRGHLEEWAEAAPPGAVRERLQDYLVLHTWKSNDPAAHLRRVAEMLARGGDAYPEHTFIASRPTPPWPAPPQKDRPPGTSFKDGMYDPRPAGLDWPVLSDFKDGLLPGPSVMLLCVPPALPGMYSKAYGMERPARLVRAAQLLSPGPWSADEAKLRTALETCADPALKAIGALAAQDAGFTTACMDALTADPGATEDALTFASAWAWRQRQPDKAVALLTRLSALQTGPHPRAADTALAGVAHLLLWGGQPVSDDVRTACGAALDRLAVFPFQPKVLDSLALLADKMGLPERSQVFRQAAAAVRKLPKIRTAPAPSQPTRDPPPPLARLILALESQPQQEPPPVDRENHKPWVQAYLIQAREYAGLKMPRRPRPWSINDLRWSIHDLQDNEDLYARVIADLEARAASPGDVRDRWCAGLALMECGAKSQATAALVNLHRETSPPRPLRARIVQRLALGGEVDAALELATPFPPQIRCEVFPLAIQALGPAFNDLDPALELGERWLAALRAANAAPPPAPGFAALYYETSGNDTNEQGLKALEDERIDDDDATVPAFFTDLEQATPHPANAKVERLSARRRALLPALYLELARSSFDSQLGVGRMLSAEQAGLAWLTKLDDVLRVLSSYPDRRLRWGDRNESAPEMILLTEAVRRPAWLAETALPALEKAGRAHNAASFRLLLPLLQCAPNDYLIVMDRMVAALPAAEQEEATAAGALIAGLRELAEPLAELDRRRGVPESPAAPPIPGVPQPQDIWSQPTSPGPAH